MRLHLLSATIMPPSSSASLRKPTAASPSNSPNCPSLHRHSPSATLDLLILILVLFSGTFLITSYFSHIFHSLSLLLPQTPHLLSLLLLLTTSLLILIISFKICCGPRSRRCGRSECKGLKNAVEFDLQLQGEELLRIGDGNKAVRDVNELPWKGGREENPNYECLRAELRKMAPPNGRAVLLFRLKCGCPVSKLEGWGPKRGRRHKKSPALTGGGDHG
ncbi:hypothetical protein BUALT_Bualt12G0128200 [Buddleja alternifolia]|uniref:Ribosomal protein L34e superfamily protein n=1 Tax=Buddleja alternifolia TaxID=168488 RepID=A0AAV6WXP4_9LAMI|nr:hypothetical protein BUALT_Bualt12G0128200 [Buddleja alternifolia]